MGREIERKFLVERRAARIEDEVWLAGVVGTRYRQGYLCIEKDRTVRVREGGGSAKLCIKAPLCGITRRELEYEIPLADAEELLAHVCIKPLIDKTRYRVRVGAHVWEVDLFHGENAPLCVAEIELGHADEAFERPGFVGAEVSDDRRYLNSSLTQRPYSTW